MTKQQFEALRNAVLNTLHYGQANQALGMLQGAGMVADVSAYSDDFEQLYSWAFMAGSCAIDRQYDNQQRQEWHETQQSLEESVR
jgi:hypothetical protein